VARITTYESRWRLQAAGTLGVKLWTTGPRDPGYLQSLHRCAIPSESPFSPDSRPVHDDDLICAIVETYLRLLVCRCRLEPTSLSDTS
jgi:hypothetical protein